jgi:hypothetical protein
MVSVTAVDHPGRQARKLAKAREHLAGRRVDLLDVEIGMQANNLKDSFLGSARLPWLQGINAKEGAPVRLVPLLKDKLVNAVAVTAPTYFCGPAAVALVWQRAKID